MKKQFLLGILFIFTFVFYQQDIFALEYNNYCTDDAINKIKTDNRGAYSYDINSISVDSSNLIINGWGLINNENGSSKIDNIAPKFTLKLESFYAKMEVDAQGNPVRDVNGNYKYIKEFRVATDGYSNVNEKYYYDSQYKTYYFGSANSTPRDYTEFFYTQTSCSRPYRFYNGSCRSSTAKARCFDYVEGDTYGNSKRGGALCSGVSESRNYMYINLNFTFKIPLSDIKNLINKYSDPNKTGKKANRIYFRLGVSTSDSITAYDNVVNTTKRNQNCIPLTFTQSLSSDLEKILVNAKILKGTSTELNVGGVKDYTNQISIMVNDAHPRSTDNFNGPWLCRDGSILTSSIAGCSDNNNPNLDEVTLYQSSLSGNQGDYYIFDEDLITNGSAYMQGLSYNTTFRLYKVRLKLEQAGISKRITGKVITVGADQRNSGTVAYIPALWIKPTLVGEGTYIDKPETTTCDTDPRCDNLDSSTTCPAGGKNTNNKTGDEATTNCCDDICKPGDTSFYCVKICNIPIETKECSLISDPQEKYCCLNNYKDQDFCLIYAQKDKPSSRSKTCLSDITIDDTFKYPTRGFGDNKFENTACKISCEEIIKTTFQPNQFVRAGMGYTYPIQINGTRYCTAEYKNDSWTNDLATRANTANTQYDIMVNALNSATTEDNKCGNLIYEYQSPSNNCGSDYQLINGVCRRVSTYAPSCGSYQSSSDTSTTTCTLSGGSCNCTTTTKGYYTPETCPKSNPKCKRVWTPEKTTPAGGGSACSSGDSYDNGTCTHYDYKDACNSGFSLSGSTCRKPICSISREDWGSAQARIGSYLNTASTARISYTSAVNRFNDLMRDRSTCDNYASSNLYFGSLNTNISYNEVGGTIQVSNQKGYKVTNSVTNGSTPIGKQTKMLYNIKEAKNKTLSASSTGYNSGIILSYSGIYTNYIDKSNVTYYDFWNEMSLASNKFEFSINYYVQRYTGDLSTVAKSGYDLGGRLVYTDFYQISETKDFDLNLSRLGPNLPESHDSSINLNPFTCSYEISNMIFPPEGDINYQKYGNTAFSFRQISLTDPFPNRSARENWKGKEKLITNKGYEVYNTSTPLYQYYLDPSRMQTIRIYNRTHSYGSYDVNNPYNSIFLDNVVRNW